MVQFVFTPWRNRAELLRVRSQFYPSASITSASTTAYSPSDLQAIQKAIARVFMWVHRGHCPHVVESTAMLMSAVVLDRRHQKDHHYHKNDDGGGGEDNGDDEDDDDEEEAAAAAAEAEAEAAASEYGVRAAYLTAFTRFVTGLLDGHQDKARKLSMYGVAKTVGLPAGFVELRHQGTHEAMPGLAQLRPAAGRALRWIWEYYWRNLLPDDGDGDDDDGDDDGGGGGGGYDDDDWRVKKERGGANAGVAAGAGDGGGEGSTGSMVSMSGIRGRMCKRALMGYLQRQDGDVGPGAAREALMRQLGQWGDLLVVRTLVDIGESARDGGLLARSVRLSREVMGQATGTEAGIRTGVHDGDVIAGGDVEEMRRELALVKEELESMQESGKRKRDGDDDDGPGWRKWDGPWTPRSIGII